MARWWWAVACGGVLAACGGGDGGDESAEIVPCGDASLWSTELIPAENPGGADLDFAADGTLHVVYRWFIPGGTGDDYDPGESRLMWLHRAGGEWMAERISADGQDNVVAYALESSGGGPHLVWRHDYNNSSVYYRRLDGSTWSPVVDLTGAIETAPVDLTLLHHHADRIALVYTTSETVMLRVRLAWIEDGAIAGEPVTLFESDAACRLTRAAFDEAGLIHLLAACPTSERQGAIYHVAGDDLMPANMVATYGWAANAAPYSPRLSLAAAPGGVLHALWTSGADDVPEALLHARRTNGQWTAPDEVAQPGSFSNLEVTAADDVIAVFFDQTTERMKLLKWSDETGFAPDCDRLPDLEAKTAYSTDLAVDPENGALLSVHGADVAGHLALSSLDVE